MSRDIQPVQQAVRDLHNLTPSNKSKPADIQRPVAQLFMSEDRPLANYRWYEYRHNTGTHYIQIQAAINIDDFLADQVDVIKEAFYKFGRVICDDVWYDMAFDNSGIWFNRTNPRDHQLPRLMTGVGLDPSYGTVEKQAQAFYEVVLKVLLYVQFPPDETWRQSPLYFPFFFERFDKEPDASGYWQLGLAEINLANSAGVVRIQLNGKALGDGSAFPSSKDTKVWAGLIGHETMHSFGWRHSDEVTVRDSFLHLVQQKVKDFA